MPNYDTKDELVTKLATKDMDLLAILMTISINPYLTTTELEKQINLPRATFYHKFRKAKKEGYLISKTNENHEIVWAISEKGKIYLVEIEEVMKQLVDTITRFKIEKWKALEKQIKEGKVKIVRTTPIEKK